MTADEAAMTDLPSGIEARFIKTANGLRVHCLEAAGGTRGTLLLLHGFPELAFSWRHLMPILAAEGYRVIAPDQRGYGRTTGWTVGYDVDLTEFGMINLVRDQVALLAALGIDHVDGVIGHDFGSPVAAWCALIRPDLFQAAICMSAPFAGPPEWAVAEDPIHDDLSALTPPRRHYQWWYSDGGANDDMMSAPGGLPWFLRAYFHCKSADWPDNRPYRLSGWTAEALAEMPRYYIMDDGVGMAATALAMAPDDDRCDWLTAADLAVYADEYGRTGFQGGLNWYRSTTSATGPAELRLYAGRRIEVPTAFIGGASDWGVYQMPGALETMTGEACADYRGTTLIDGAGHWVQQEQPAKTAKAVLSFLQGL
ncbi:MAG: alpha/beta hydrolase [Pseudomonadota bacterium]